jgi:hypothetical protein
VERIVRQHPLGPPEHVGAEVQDGAPQNVTVIRHLVWLLAPPDDRQTRPAQTVEGIGNGVVGTPVVTGKVPGTDPVRRLGTGRGGRLEGELGVQGRLQGRNLDAANRDAGLECRACAFRIRPGRYTSRDVSSTRATVVATTSAGVSVSNEIW